MTIGKEPLSLCLYLFFFLFSFNICLAIFYVSRAVVLVGVSSCQFWISNTFFLISIFFQKNTYLIWKTNNNDINISSSSFPNTCCSCLFLIWDLWNLKVDWLYCIYIFLNTVFQKISLCYYVFLTYDNASKGYVEFMNFILDL